MPRNAEIIRETVVTDRESAALGTTTTLTTTTDPAYVRKSRTLANANMVAGHWGDRLRIQEVTGGATITTDCIYSIHVAGRIN